MVATQRISHIEHRVPGTGVWRPGSTSHEESGTDLEGYLRPLEQVHCSALHGSGIAEGLTVLASPGSATVRVGPGVAVDSAGRHIVLTPGGQVEVSDDPEHSSRLLTLSADGVDLSTVGQSGSCQLTVQWRETFDKQLLEDTFQQTFLDRHTPWLRILPAGVPSPDVRVVLATLSLDAAGLVQPNGLSADGRQGVSPGVEALRISTAARTSSPAGITVAEAAAGQLRARPGGGLQLQVADPAGQLEFLAKNGNIAKVSLSTDRFALRRADGAEPIVLDTAGGRLGVGTAPSHPLHVSGNKGIRQNELYLGGGAGWSSLSYNAHHNEGNNNWVFPNPSRPAVTIEMDDAGGVPRFQVWSTTPANTTGWALRLNIDGQTGVVTVPGTLNVGAGGSVKGRFSVSNNGTDATFSADNQTGNAICATANTGTAVVAVSNGTALSTIGPSQFNGNVDVHGTLTASAKNFLIDHPLDPENKYLAHTSVESSERANIYSGNVVLDDNGEASVRLQDWVEALNKEFRYQLTCIGQAAPVYIAQEVSEGAFTIAGGAAGMKVSWQLTGIRDDPWARENQLVVEEEKPDGEKGFFRHPEVLGHDLTNSVYYTRNEELIRRNPRVAKRMLRSLRKDGDTG